MVHAVSHSLPNLIVHCENERDEKQMRMSEINKVNENTHRAPIHEVTRHTLHGPPADPYLLHVVESPKAQLGPSRLGWARLMARSRPMHITCTRHLQEV
jgi:hypothetical protein